MHAGADNAIDENKNIYNVTKKEHIIISIGSIIGGWLLCGFAMTTTLGHPISTTCVILGLGFSISGFISFILALKKPTVKKK
jgi:hypothetical protein